MSTLRKLTPISHDLGFFFRFFFLTSKCYQSRFVFDDLRISLCVSNRVFLTVLCCLLAFLRVSVHMSHSSTWILSNMDVSAEKSPQKNTKSYHIPYADDHEIHPSVIDAAYPSGSRLTWSQPQADFGREAECASLSRG